MHNLREFDIERSSLIVQIDYRSRFWGLVHEIPRLYEALLRGLADFGVLDQNIRSDSGDGSLGGFKVNLWMLNYAAHVQLSLTGAELRCENLKRVALDQLEGAFVRLTEALVAADNDLAIQSYRVTIELHGQPQGVATKEFLATFVNTPEKDELGPSLGSGALFYFGERPPVMISNFGVDLSGAIDGKLYFRSVNVLDGAAVGPPDVRNVILERLRVSLEAVGLQADLN